MASQNDSDSPCWCPECGGDPSPDPPEPSQELTLIEETGKGEQHCRWCRRMSYVGDTDAAVTHYRDCPSWVVKALRQRAEHAEGALATLRQQIRALEQRHMNTTVDMSSDYSRGQFDGVRSALDLIFAAQTGGR